MAGRPSFQFYPGDWRKDPGLRTCTLAARGLWLEMMLLMHESDRYGHLCANGRPMSARDIAVAVGAEQGQQEIQELLVELEQKGVFSRLKDGTIFCRRMVRDAAQRDKAAERQRRRREQAAERAQRFRARNASVTLPSRSRNAFVTPKKRSSNAGGNAGNQPLENGLRDVTCNVTQKKRRSSSSSSSSKKDPSGSERSIDPSGTVSTGSRESAGADSWPAWYQGITWNKAERKVEFTEEAKHGLSEHLGTLAEEEQLPPLTRPEAQRSWGRLNGYLMRNRQCTGPKSLPPIVVNWFENDLRDPNRIRGRPGRRAGPDAFDEAIRKAEEEESEQEQT